MNRLLIRRRSRAGAERGFSLVELMIALTIGLVVIAAVGYIFSASKRTARQSDGLSRIQDSARGALLLMNTAIHNAGFLPNPIAESDPSFFFKQTTGTPPVNTMAIYGGLGTDLLTDYPWIPANPAPKAGANGYDYLAISFLGDTDNDPTNSLNGSDSLKSCLGQSVPDIAYPSAQQVVVNVYYIAQDTTENLPSLYCAAKYYDPNASFTGYALKYPPQAIVSNIISMSIRYGIDFSGGLQTDRYLTAAEVTSGAGGASWTRVSSIQITLVTTTPETVAAGQADQGIIKGGHFNVTQTQTIAIRNRLE